MGMPGVYAFGTFDTWSPGYLMFIAATHNGISRLYETFGNSGSADTLDRTLSPAETSRTLVPAESAAAVREVVAPEQQQLRDDGLLVSLNHIANNRVYFLRNFYDKSKRSITKARTEGPAAYVLPANDPTARQRRLSCCGCCRSSASKCRGQRPRSRCRCPCVRSQPAAAQGGRGGRRDSRGRARTRCRRRWRSTDDAAGHAGAASPAYRKPRVPGRQLHHPHGSAVLAHRRCVARLSVPGRRTIPSRTRTTTRAGRSRKALPCRRCVCSIRRSSTCRCSSRQGRWLRRRA